MTAIVDGNVDDVNSMGEVEASGSVLYLQYTVTNASDQPLPKDFKASGLSIVNQNKKAITPKTRIAGLKNCDGRLEPPAGITKGESYTSCTVVRGDDEVLGAGFTEGGGPYSPDYRSNPIIWKK
ncbi:hypothetical protein nbrc107696_05060 [Gordonia spumicola]|uniref:DUF4352 domain-containing protein n=1 Tax=Gordonia spumicola TaxID=589161 RepID=A0A7I9V4V4_9ACTN|nr:hypothetical protein [Gordonia spumicola]GEE00060.1 hypothetical protein nbrc107696_05060 [Gordonia spumicola]